MKGQDGVKGRRKDSLLVKADFDCEDINLPCLPAFLVLSLLQMEIIEFLKLHLRLFFFFLVTQNLFFPIAVKQLPGLTNCLQTSQKEPQECSRADKVGRSCLWKEFSSSKNGEDSQQHWKGHFTFKVKVHKQMIFFSEHLLFLFHTP